MNEIENLNGREAAEASVLPEGTDHTIEADPAIGAGRPIGAGLPETDVLPAYLFHQGTNYKAYEYLGAHCEKTGEGYVYTFRVWAPNATFVTLNADFTDWHNGLPFRRITKNGIWEAVVESEVSLDGMFYKFAVTGRNGTTWLKSDPYAFSSETLLKNASVLR